MKLLTRLLTRNLTRVPLFWVTFNWPHYRKHVAKDSCMCNIHPTLAEDEYIRVSVGELMKYIREHYDMEKLL